MSFISKSFENQIPQFDPIIIPPKVLHLLRKLSSGEGNLKIAVGEKNLFMQFDSQKISSSLIDGQFPNYKRVVPEQQKYEAVIKRDVFEEALKRVSLLVEHKSRRIYLNLSEGNLTLTSEESEIGIAKEELECVYEGPDITIALNYLYLAEPLRVMDDAEIIIRFSEPNKAISLLSNPEKEFFHIVMPMQLD